jgi:hypothetical protein
MTAVTILKGKYCSVSSIICLSGQSRPYGRTWIIYLKDSMIVGLCHKWTIIRCEIEGQSTAKGTICLSTTIDELVCD